VNAGVSDSPAQKLRPSSRASRQSYAAPYRHHEPCVEHRCNDHQQLAAKYNLVVNRTTEKHNKYYTENSKTIIIQLIIIQPLPVMVSALLPLSWKLTPF